MANYYINGTDLADYGFIAGRYPGSNQALEGFFDMPERIGKTYHDWPDEAGVEPYVDEEDIRLGGLDMALHGIIVGESAQDALDKAYQLNAFIASHNDLVKLSGKLWTRDIYVKEEMTIDYIGHNTCTVVIKLREPVLNVLNTSVSNYAVTSIIEPKYAHLINGIDGITFASFGLQLLSMEGYLNRPETKEWPMTAYDSEGYRVTPAKNRTIKLKLFFEKKGSLNASISIRKLQKLFIEPGLRYFTVDDAAVFSFFVDKGFKVKNIVENTTISGVLEMEVMYDYPTQPPAAPTGLTAEALSYSEIELNWVDESSNETGFQIYRSLDGATFELVHTTEADVTTWTDSDLNQNTLYYYQVCAVENSLSGDFSNIASATTDFNLTWTSSAIAANNLWTGLAYGSNAYVAIAISGTNVVMKSLDGFDWYSVSSPDNVWYGIVYGDNKFCAVGALEDQRVMISTDAGESWSLKNTSSETYRDVAFGEHTFIAVGSAFAKSSDGGETWTEIADPDGISYWTGVTYGNGIFVAVSSSNYRIAYSTDLGETWSFIDTPVSISFYRIAYGDGVFVAIAASSNLIMKSSDGINWSVVNIGSSISWTDIAFGNGVWVIISSSGTERIIYSRDLVNWTNQVAPQANNWYRICFGDNRFVALANNNGTERAMISSEV